MNLPLSTSMALKHKRGTSFAIIALILASLCALLFGCTTAPSTTQSMNGIIKITVQVTSPPIVSTKVIEKVVVREVPISADPNQTIVTVVVTATPEEMASTPVPTPKPTERPAEDIGQKGDFTPEDLDKLFEIWDEVEDKFYGDLPSDEILTDAIISAAMEQLNDRYTTYFSPDLAQQIQDGFQGDFEGIGAYVDSDEDGFFYIVRPIPNTPAFAAGLKPADVVLAVDGTPVVGWETDAIIAVVRGPRGEAVTLTIQREGTPDPFDVSITRDRIEVPVVESQLLADGKVGYVRLIRFNQLATAQLEPAIQAHIDAGAESIIFDMRDNGGGFLQEAVTIGDLFLDDGKFVIIRNSDGTIEEYETKTEAGNDAEQIPLVVLINEFSASASELVSGALKDRGRATLIGTTTFGKGSVQNVFNLDDGSEFRVTVARFFSPNDNVINEVGIEPDITFEYRPDILGDENDLTLQRAIEFIVEGE